MKLNKKIEQLEKQIVELKQEAVSRNNQHNTINSVEDAFNLLKPEWNINCFGTIRDNNCNIFGDSKCNATSEKRSKQLYALNHLHWIAEAMNIGVESSKEYFYVTRFLDVDWITYTSVSLVLPIFNKRELAEEALKKFRDLFKDLYMLK